MPHSRSHKTHRRSRSKSHKTHRRHHRSTSRKMRRCPRGSRKTCRKISRKTRSSHRKRGGSALGEWWKKKRQSWEEAKKAKNQTMGDETLGKALRDDATKAAEAIKDTAQGVGIIAQKIAKMPGDKLKEKIGEIKASRCEDILQCLRENTNELRELLDLIEVSSPVAVKKGGKRRKHSRKYKKYSRRH